MYNFKNQFHIAMPDAEGWNKIIKCKVIVMNNIDNMYIAYGQEMKQ